MTYIFEKHASIRISRFKGGKFIKVGFSTGYISREFMREMDISETKRVFLQIFVDKDNNAIAIEILDKPSNGSYTSKNGYLSTRSLAKDIATGKYVFKEKQDKRYIFVIE